MATHAECLSLPTVTVSSSPSRRGRQRQNAHDLHLLYPIHESDDPNAMCSRSKRSSVLTMDERRASRRSLSSMTLIGSSESRPSSSPPTSAHTYEDALRRLQQFNMTDSLLSLRDVTSRRSSLIVRPWTSGSVTDDGEEAFPDSGGSTTNWVATRSGNLVRSLSRLHRNGQGKETTVTTVELTKQASTSDSRSMPGSPDATIEQPSQNDASTSIWKRIVRSIGCVSISIDDRKGRQ
ncbi:hypothetical protein BCR37DRAFT_389006 [Protomyces lactucae-debilis]|uniref:Uncharacterized protein n=1 Tax=Protomyces lactucae-debilis TaxID=2754530 RepID=A0A1Y2F1W8_PROLT|nr:uncharacterized protein BCR37DRAFT_389006 [Protomyces lactucae-debilis]ORY77697.1 hypothetical protein BCR37DRAFT_389006 [Protomyces lactucae-debilis]